MRVLFVVHLDGGGGKDCIAMGESNALKGYCKQGHVQPKSRLISAKKSRSDYILPPIYANRQRYNDDQRVAMSMTPRSTSHSAPAKSTSRFPKIPAARAAVIPGQQSHVSTSSEGCPSQLPKQPLSPAPGSIFLSLSNNV